MTEAGDDGRTRCFWAGSDPLYRHYHDAEWGRPVVDDNRLFEKLCLEGFQSGLAWITVLRKRERFREVFHGFDIGRVAAMGEADIERLVLDAGIIRHRGKIASTINNAKRAPDLQQEFGSLAAYIWQFEPKPEHRPDRLTLEALRPWPRPMPRAPCRRICASAASASSAPPPATPSCRPWASSTTTSRTASAGRKWKPCGATLKRPASLTFVCGATATDGRAEAVPGVTVLPKQIRAPKSPLLNDQPGEASDDHHSTARRGGVFAVNCMRPRLYRRLIWSRPFHRPVNILDIT